MNFIIQFSVGYGNRSRALERSLGSLVGVAIAGAAGRFHDKVHLSTAEVGDLNYNAGSFRVVNI